MVMALPPMEQTPMAERTALVVALVLVVTVSVVLYTPLI
jgi:hypothetical protein